MRRALFTGFTLLAFGLALPAACQTLPDIASGVCGNAIVDPGEDCDAFPVAGVAGGLACRPAGQPGQCTFECKDAASQRGYACPAGYSCGPSDGLCRRPSGHFAPWGATVPVQTSGLSLHDMNGDGSLDVVATGDASTTLLYFGPGGALSNQWTLPSRLVGSSIGKLTSGVSSDFSVSLTDGIGVLLGQRDGSLLPNAYPTLTFGSDSAFFLGLERIPPHVYVCDPDHLAHSDVEPFLLLANAGGLPYEGLARQDPCHVGAGNVVRLLRVPGSPPQLAGFLQAPIHQSLAPCDDVAFAFRGRQEVIVYSPCVAGVKGIHWKHDDAAAVWTDPLSAVVLPVPAPIAAGPFAFQREVPGAPGQPAVIQTDLFVSTRPGAASTCNLYLLHGLGEGAFAPAECFVVPPDVALEVPLAIGDLNADGQADFVFSDGVYVSDSVNHLPALTAVASPDPDIGLTRWSSAVIADLNGNAFLGKGYVDVMAGSAQSASMDFLSGGGLDGLGHPLLDRFSVPTQLPVSYLAVGDFDGDLVNDLAVSQSEADVNFGNSTPSILWGKLDAPPEPPVSLGTLGVASELVVGHFATQDNVATFAVKSTIPNASTPMEGISILRGRGDRLVVAPYGLNVFGMTDGSTFEAKPIRTAIGHFTSPAHSDLLSVGLDVQSKAIDGHFSLRFWLGRGAGDAQGTLAPAVSGAALDSLTGALASCVSNPTPACSELLDEVTLATGDLQGDGLEEALLLVPKASNGSVFVASLAAEAFIVSGPQLTSAGGVPAGPAEVAVELGHPAHAAFVKLDPSQPGGQDLVLLTHPTRSGPRLFVFWNHSGQLDFTTPTEVMLPASPLGFAAYHADTGSRVQLAVVTASATYRVDFDGRQATPASLEDLIGGRAIAAGDLDGDGLDDLVIGLDSGVTVYRAVPLAPGATGG